ncbi:MAG TPA: hypothetical protein VFK21_11570 [Gammaproteobacteria bacterium]|nr:hypothetical protein [Gammaproteobacteria bacterium]
MNFFIDKNAEKVKGILAYRKEEHSLSFELSSDQKDLIGFQGRTSLTFQTLQAEVDIASKRLLYLWGYFPIVNAISGDISELDSQNASVTVQDVVLRPGVSIEFLSARKWKKVFDRNMKFIYFGPEELAFGETRIQICNDAIICFSENQPVSMIIRLNRGIRLAT